MASQEMLGGSPTHPGSFASFDSPPSFPPVQRKPLPPNVDLIPGLVHPSSPSSNEGDKPTFIPPAPVARSPSPSSVDGDPDISVQKNSNRYATHSWPPNPSPDHAISPRLSLLMKHDVSCSYGYAPPGHGRLMVCTCFNFLDIPETSTLDPCTSIPPVPVTPPLLT